VKEGRTAAFDGCVGGVIALDSLWECGEDKKVLRIRTCTDRRLRMNQRRLQGAYLQLQQLRRGLQYLLHWSNLVNRDGNLRRRSSKKFWMQLLADIAQKLLI